MVAAVAQSYKEGKEAEEAEKTKKRLANTMWVNEMDEGPANTTVQIIDLVATFTPGSATHTITTPPARGRGRTLVAEAATVNQDQVRPSTHPPTHPPKAQAPTHPPTQ